MLGGGDEGRRNKQRVASSLVGVKTGVLLTLEREMRGRGTETPVIHVEIRDAPPPTPYNRLVHREVISSSR